MFRHGLQCIMPAKGFTELVVALLHKTRSEALYNLGSGC